MLIKDLPHRSHDRTWLGWVILRVIRLNCTNLMNTKHTRDLCVYVRFERLERRKRRVVVVVCFTTENQCRDFDSGRRSNCLRMDTIKCSIRESSNRNKMKIITIYVYSFNISFISFLIKVICLTIVLLILTLNIL